MCWSSDKKLYTRVDEEKASEKQSPLLFVHTCELTYFMIFLRWTFSFACSLFFVAFCSLLLLVMMMMLCFGSYIGSCVYKFMKKSESSLCTWFAHSLTRPRFECLPSISSSLSIRVRIRTRKRRKQFCISESFLNLSLPPPAKSLSTPSLDLPHTLLSTFYFSPHHILHSASFFSSIE